MERELGHTGYALQMLAVARPSRILLACEGDQRERYLLPAVAGERTECLAMTEPEAGSDLRGMRTRRGPRRRRLGDHGTKHFISHADAADFVILFAATGEQTRRRRTPPREITAFLVDTRHARARPCCPATAASRIAATTTPCWSSTAAGCRASAVLGEVGCGFDVANTWLGTTRLQVAASCLGRARRALDLAVRHAATRRQFGQPIGRNQGVAFKLADMATALESATWLTWRAAWLRRRGHGRGRPGDRDGQARRDRDARQGSPTRRCRSTAAWA